MSFSSRRRNYLLTPHRRDGLTEWMKSLLTHSFVLDALDETAPGTFAHCEMLIEEHRKIAQEENDDNGDSTPRHPLRLSQLKQLVPSVGTFHTHLPLRKAFEAYNAKYCLTARHHVQITFNELRHILNLAQIMAMRGIQCHDEECDISYDRWTQPISEARMSKVALEFSRGLIRDDDNDDDEEDATSENGGEMDGFEGPKMITFDGDQTLYSDGANFESNPKLANHLYVLLLKGVTIAVVTAAGYEYESEKYTLRLSGLFAYFKEKSLPPEACARFYLFGGECNYLLHLGQDYKLHPVKETGAGGWMSSTKYIPDTPGNWDDEQIKDLLDKAETTVNDCVTKLKIRGRVLRKKRAVGLIPTTATAIPREVLDEVVLCIQHALGNMDLPYCAFNGGRDAWVDVGNKRVGVQILQSYMGIEMHETLHIGDQFLNTGNDYAARSICPCVWITDPEETTYILKSILRLAGVALPTVESVEGGGGEDTSVGSKKSISFSDVLRRKCSVELMDVYTGEMKQLPQPQDK